VLLCERSFPLCSPDFSLLSYLVAFNRSLQHASIKMSSANAMTASSPPAPAASNATSKQQKTVVTPYNNLSSRMSVPKNVVDELLLVCGVIGTTDERGKFIPVTDCLAWLQDLQRALRRDDDSYRPISLLLSQWKIVSQKLIPLVLMCNYDSALVLTVCKSLVILTKPLSPNTIRAAHMVIDTKKNSEE
jgi:timeless